MTTDIKALCREEADKLSPHSNECRVHAFMKEADECVCDRAHKVEVIADALERMFYLGRSIGFAEGMPLPLSGVEHV